MTYVRETIVTSKNSDNTIKVSPLGIYIDNDILRIKPFKPSTSLENLLRNKLNALLELHYLSTKLLDPYLCELI